mmetsp:Transcript_31140/g.78912  ORF Transcript_31140/g.78912 Transcript_31140/m.78912 type:complete len:296 (-) Transcript_31140:2939-3826(-)
MRGIPTDSANVSPPLGTHCAGPSLFWISLRRRQQDRENHFPIPKRPIYLALAIRAVEVLVSHKDYDYGCHVDALTHLLDMVVADLDALMDVKPADSASLLLNHLWNSKDEPLRHKCCFLRSFLWTYFRAPRVAEKDFGSQDISNSNQGIAPVAWLRDARSNFLFKLVEKPFSIKTMRIGLTGTDAVRARDGLAYAEHRKKRLHLKLVPPIASARDFKIKEKFGTIDLLVHQALQLLILMNFDLFDQLFPHKLARKLESLSRTLGTKDGFSQPIADIRNRPPPCVKVPHDAFPQEF